MDFYPLKIQQTIEHLGGFAKTLVFEVPSKWSKLFAWQAGQHIKVRLLIEGREMVRAYTISSAPGGELKITVKRLEGGRVSPYLNDRLQKGDLVEVKPPSGKFLFKEAQSYQFICAGSGITPIYAMLETLTGFKERPFCQLLYANRNEKQVLFQRELQEWEQRGVVEVTYLFSKPSSLVCHQGRVDLELLRQKNDPLAELYYLCGPGKMNEKVQMDLLKLGVPRHKIVKGRFAKRRD